MVSKRSSKKSQRQPHFATQSTAFYYFLEMLGNSRPMEGTQEFKAARDAFKAGWEAHRFKLK